MGTLSPRRCQILALSGGGYRGLFGAKFLTECEAEFKTKCVERFDILAGTSIGALLAAGLSASVPATTLAAIMEDFGPKIFKRSLLTGAKQILVAAPYSPLPIKEAIRKTLGRDIAKKSLRAHEPPLIITTVNYTTGETIVLRSKGIAGRAADDVSLEDAILASAAAPTFFPTKRIGPSEYIDGGLAANAPDMIAIFDALKHLNAKRDEIYHLSIGTASRRQGAAVHDKARAPGSINWVARQGLVQSIMAAQEHLALSQANEFLGNQFLRIDQEPAQNQVRAINSLDRADKAATDTLTLLAQSAWAEHKSARPLRDFFLR